MILLFPFQLSAQWKDVLRDTASDYVGIYFLDAQGAPEVGFVGGIPDYGSQVYKTTDGGESWRPIPLDKLLVNQVLGFTFKDKQTGWLADVSGVFKTTDGGDTWQLSSIGSGVQSQTYDVFYLPRNAGLFTSGDFQGLNNIVSWDEGQSWTHDGPRFDCYSLGIAFWDDGTGIATNCYGAKWQRSLDGGHTWSTLALDSFAYVLDLIPGSHTGFALTPTGGFLRTDDAWSSWTVLYQFPRPPLLTVDPAWEVYSSSCVVGSVNNLYVLMGDGLYHSTDEGVTWQSMCGVPSAHYDLPRSRLSGLRHFVVSNRKAFISTVDSHYVAHLWKLDLDSLHKTGLPIVHFENGSKRASISPGSDLTVYYSNTTADTSVAEDSAHFVIRYDQNSMSLKSWTGLNGWNIVSANPLPGSIEVWLHGSGTLNTLPILSTTFATILADTVAKVYLEEPVIYSHRKNCDCAVTSNPGSDSVEIDFTGCGGPTLWHFMQTGSIFELLSIEPNPASGSVMVALDKRDAGEVAIGVSDVLGNTRLTATTSESRTSLDVSHLPSGTYFLRASEAGTVRTRRFVVNR